jgi:hypothetical protein
MGVESEASFTFELERETSFTLGDMWIAEVTVVPGGATLRACWSHSLVARPLLAEH